MVYCLFGQRSKAQSSRLPQQGRLLTYLMPCLIIRAPYGVATRAVQTVMFEKRVSVGFYWPWPRGFFTFNFSNEVSIQKALLVSAYQGLYHEIIWPVA